MEFPIRSFKFLVALLFFTSGFCGLLYQLIWMRLAYASFGVNTPVMSVVLSVFMTGLALGSLLGGTLTRLWNHRPAAVSLIYYAGIEALIGLGAFAVPYLFSWGQTILLPLGNGDSNQYLFFSSVVIFVALIPWCACMGATFPLMMDYIRKTSKEDDSFSFLYKANVFGAMTGVLVTAFLLIEILGFRGVLNLGAFLNFSISLISVIAGIYTFCHLFGSKLPLNRPLTEQSRLSQTIGPDLMVLFSTGFICMALEVIWTRDFTIVLKTQVYSFAALLFVYLLSTFFGSWIYRAARKTMIIRLPLLLIFTLATSLIPLVMDDPRIQQSFYGVLLSIMPFCIVLGYLTPMLIDRFSKGDPRLAAKAYAVNVLGCILGPLAASYLLLPHLGVKYSMIFLSFMFVPFFHKGIREVGSLSPIQKAVVVLILLLGLLMIGRSFDYESVPCTYYPRSTLYRDYAATAISGGEQLNKRLYVNGIAMTDLDPTTKVMAHLPLALLPHPAKSALDICFGMGTTYRSLLSWNIQVTAVELVPSVYKSFGYFFDDADRLRGLPNGHMVVDDGRRYLKRTDQKFDVITIDPPPPIEAAGSSLLYSAEFLEIIKQHLTQGGILQLWMPASADQLTSEAIARTITQCFPFVRVFPSVEYVSLARSIQKLGYFFIASTMPIQQITPQEMVNKLPESAKKDLLEWYSNFNCEQVFKKILSLEIKSEKIVNLAFNNKITDDRPFNEYYLLRNSNFWFEHP